MLIINKEIQTKSGITANNLAIWIQITLNTPELIICNISEYYSKQAKTAGSSSLAPTFVYHLQINYVRENDGADALLFAHQKVKQYLIDNFGFLESEIFIDLQTDFLTGLVNEI